MKHIRYVLIAISLMCYMMLSAEVPGGSGIETPIYDSSRPEKFMDLKVQFTVGGSTVVNNYGSVIMGLQDMQFSPGALLRPGINAYFRIRNSLAIGTGLEIGIHNSRCALSLVDAKTSSINSVYLKNHFYDVNIPVYVSISLNLGRRIKGVVDFGGYIAYGIGGHTRASGYSSGQNSLGQPIINHVFYEKKYFDEDMSVINSVERFDFGPRLSAGFVYRSHYSFNWVFQMSARNLSINHNVLDVRYRHLTLGFEVGYVF